MPFVRTPCALAWMLVPLLAAGLAAGCGTHTGHAAAQGAAATNAATTPDTIAQTSWTLTRWTSVGGQPRPSKRWPPMYRRLVKPIRMHPANPLDRMQKPVLSPWIF